MRTKPDRDTRHHDEAWYGRNPDVWRPEEADIWDIVNYREFNNEATGNRDREGDDRPLVDYAGCNDHFKWIRNPPAKRSMQVPPNDRTNRKLY